MHVVDQVFAIKKIFKVANKSLDFCICEADIYAIANVPLMLPYVNT
jgi:hypothetical protein